MLPNIIQNSVTPLYVGLNAPPENRIGEYRLAGRCSGNSHKIASKIHELQIEMVACSRAGIGTYAETLVVDVLIRISADYINEKQIRATLLIVYITEFTAQIETVEMGDACHIARAYSENGKLWFFICRLNHYIVFAAFDFQHAFYMRQHETLRRIIGIGQMNLDLFEVFVGDGIEKSVPTATAEGRNDPVALPPELIDYLENIRAVKDARFHAVSFATQTGNKWFLWVREPP